RKRSDNPARLCYLGAHGSGKGLISMILGLLVVTVVFFAVLLWVVSVYNGLITLRNLVDSAWAQTDVQLRRRYDLIPNLVEIVKGYAAHERETLDSVTRARAAAESASGPA